MRELVATWREALKLLSSDPAAVAAFTAATTALVTEADRRGLRELADRIDALRQGVLLALDGARPGEQLAALSGPALRFAYAAADRLEALPAAAPTPAKPRPRRRRKAARAPTPLTPQQTEAVQLVGEHGGNVSAAARAAGKSPAAMRKLYQKAMRKLGMKAPTHKTAALPLDRRGQPNVSEDRRRG
jgi:hypothetical protein